MLRLRNPDVGPPEDSEGRNYRYYHRATNHWSGAFDRFTWMQRIRDHCKGNDLPMVTAEEAEDQLCRSLPPEQCYRDPGDAPGINANFTWKDFVAGTTAFLKVLLSGFVPQSEANRRAKVCANCYFNVGISGCGTCAKMATVLTGEIANKKTEYDSQLKGCAACKCSVPAMVWFPLESLNIEEKQPRLPDFCWQKTGGENYLQLGGQTVNRQVHTLEIVGSNPTPAI